MAAGSACWSRDSPEERAAGRPGYINHLACPCCPRACQRLSDKSSTTHGANKGVDSGEEVGQVFIQCLIVEIAVAQEVGSTAGIQHISDSMLS